MGTGLNDRLTMERKRRAFEISRADDRHECLHLFHSRDFRGAGNSIERKRLVGSAAAIINERRGCSRRR